MRPYSGKGGIAAGHLPVSMTANELGDYLRTQIPLTVAMGVVVRELSAERVCLTAPLAPNINHHQTAFGGSVAALAVLSGWALLHARLASRPRPVSLVIQRQQLDYLAPVDAAFEAVCRAPLAADWDRFVHTLDTRGRARLELQASVHCQGRTAASFTGQYVAVAAVDPPQRA